MPISPGNKSTGNGEAGLNVSIPSSPFITYAPSAAPSPPFCHHFFLWPLADEPLGQVSSFVCLNLRKHVALH